jgi:N-acetylneuraminate 9-O-acetyltransferase
VLSINTDLKRSLSSPLLKLLIETSPLVLVIGYAFYADRTSLFNKVHKKHDPQDFVVLCFSTFAVGILSVRQPVKPTQGTVPFSKPELADQPVLSRDQTDEWKGWMQYVILIYHYTGSSQILGIYKVIRILVASYLFMTGFGHTMFFYKKSDYSLRRCAAVLIRLNFLSCLLPFAMGTEYLFYYFAPLITFWYMVIYLTMRIGHSRNSSMVFLVTKVMIAVGIVTFLIKSPGVLETIFTVLMYTCNIKWNVIEWRFRLQLDAYIVFVGMLCGIAFTNVSEAFQDQPEKKALPSLIRRYWVWIRTVAVASALVALPTYWLFAARFSNKADYNRWVPYLSWIPILSFVILRNCTRRARNFRSSLFVWLGRHSLETFTLQFHIWLAADTKGLLALGVFGRTWTAIDGRWAEFVLVTIVFFWMSWRVATATAVITSWIVGPRTNPDDREVGIGIELPLRPGRISFIEDRTAQGGKARFLAHMWQRLCRLLSNSLAARLLLILGTMWVLNWVSAPGLGGLFPCRLLLTVITLDILEKGQRCDQQRVFNLPFGAAVYYGRFKMPN